MTDTVPSALLVIDLQKGVLPGCFDADGVLARVRQLVDRARATGTPVVWVQHNDDNLVHGSPEWQLAPELKRGDDEPMVDKNYGDSFEGTTLESVLAGLGVGRLVVAGAQTDQCIRSTIHGAFARGYDTILVKDAHTTSDLSEWGAPPPAAVIDHTNQYWEYQDAPGKKAGTVGTKDVDFAG